MLEVCSRESQQVFGGLAYTRGGRAGRVEQIGRDVRVLVVSGGSEEILADMVTKQVWKQAQESSKFQAIVATFVSKQQHQACIMDFKGFHGVVMEYCTSKFTSFTGFNNRCHAL